MKRMLLAIVGGIICAVICAIGKKYLNPTITLSVLLSSAIGNRILMGFVIGISQIKINYLLHGALIGLVVTLSYSIGMLTENIQGFIIYTVVGIIYGVFIEFFVTKVGNASCK